ncbi:MULTISPECIES: hypothetical protein [Ramlibacter]|uniref:Uncharacterized protein n=1 Tax=Ramlibacter pinisoli TaxID=2682844 RepID=A0A6N8IYJ7_9BURK|nr:MULTISPECIES: hypothetical protein [Ramlibacter]MBA2961092.1 hypothetical protein [Ramlibacter sp. CGMCC 1.13660]MVQ31036.1 hypothetical protein [Ramlibacter pinisoli]
MHRRAVLAGSGAALALWAGGAPAQAAETVHELAIAAGVLPAGQRLQRAVKGDRLRWRITSDTAGELHLHAYRLAVAVQPGRIAELAFTANASGRFRASWHPAGATNTDRHDAPLLVLEVQPR